MSSVVPLRRLALRLLGGLVEAHVGGGSAPASARARLLSAGYLAALVRSCAEDHSLASVTADGRRGGGGGIWSVGVGEAAGCVKSSARPPTLSGRHRTAGTGFDVHHAMMWAALAAWWRAGTGGAGAPFSGAVAAALATLEVEGSGVDVRVRALAAAEAAGGLLWSACEGAGDADAAPLAAALAAFVAGVAGSPVDWRGDWADAGRFVASGGRPSAAPFVRAVVASARDAVAGCSGGGGGGGGDAPFASAVKWLSAVQGPLIELLSSSGGGYAVGLGHARLLLPTLLDGLEAPYKAAREEIGRTMFLMLSLAWRPAGARCAAISRCSCRCCHVCVLSLVCVVCSNFCVKVVPAVACALVHVRGVSAAAASSSCIASV